MIIYETDFGKDKIQDAVLAAGKQNTIHPVKDFIEDCHAEWVRRGSPRGNLERLWIDYLLTSDTPFHRESARMFLTAAVARIYEPGCKFDAMAIIEGPTGSRKSTFWEVLFGGFCSDLDADLDQTGRLIENLRGWWVKEMAEMKVARRADSNTLKRTLSATHDQFRLAYGRREMEFPRQNVFVGTSNEDDYLSDPTSSRRYWVLRTPTTEENPIDTDRLEKNLWMFIGEARQMYLDMRASQPHGRLWLDLHDPVVQRERDKIAEGSRRRTVFEEIADVIADWLDKRHPASEVMVDKDGLVLDGYADDDTPMWRNMVTAQDAHTALENQPTLRPYQADVRTFGKALGLVAGWREVGRVRRHGLSQRVWFCREQDGPLWVPAPPEEDEESGPGDLGDLI